MIDKNRVDFIAAEIERIKAAKNRPFFMLQDDLSGFLKPGFHIWHDEYAQWANHAKSWPAFDRVLEVFRACGFMVLRDHEVMKHYPSLKNHNRQAATGRLRAKIRRSGRLLEIKLYADPNPTHRYPEHGENVGGHLSYLERVRARRLFAALREMLLQLGYADASAPRLVDPYEIAEFKARESWWWVDGDKSIFDRPGYLAKHSDNRANFRDRDGARLSDGDWRCFYDYNGRLRRGQVFYDLNSTWLVVSGGGLRSVSASDLFVPPPGARPPRFDPRRRKDRLECVLKARVAALELERAIPVRDLLRGAA